MQLTPLEILLGGGLISFVSALAVRLWFGGRYISREECRLQREMFLRYKKDMNIIFAMLRGVVAHMKDLTPEQRERILNMRLDEKKE
jgi:hypothetical protein